MGEHPQEDYAVPRCRTEFLGARMPWEIIMLTNILNFPSYMVTELQETAYDYLCHGKGISDGMHPLWAAELGTVWAPRTRVKDLPMHGKRVGLYLSTRRFLCKACCQTFYEVLPDIDSKRLMTHRLVAWIGQQALQRTFASIADEVGVVQGTVRRVFKDYVAELEQTVHFETPNWMGPSMKSISSVPGRW
ncbi:helix-turn-helix domain-containing protein [Sulfobacillus thermosulfidooxidans]|uniref:helix-turn-helix domain-containing protein n=1 Tax=Sulfobacillus thermosulfidooxidans TaxID=28034 RepID=UPI0006858084|nr:helix-turn-helix domain-containing protein [Sulfobacillus thermosulfidooxidans]